MALKSPPKKLSSFNALVEQAAVKRAEMNKAKAVLSVLTDEYNEIEVRLIRSMIESGTEQHRTQDGGVSLKRETKPHVHSWQEVDKFILKEQNLALLHRRLTTTAWREYGDNGILVPGTEAFTNTSLLWRSAK